MEGLAIFYLTTAFTHGSPHLLSCSFFPFFQAGTRVVFLTISLPAEDHSTPLCCKWNGIPNHSQQAQDLLLFLSASPVPCSPLSRELLAHRQAPLYLERTLLLPTLIRPILRVSAWRSNPSKAVPQPPTEESTSLVFPISAAVLG